MLSSYEIALRDALQCCTATVREIYRSTEAVSVQYGTRVRRLQFSFLETMMTRRRRTTATIRNILSSLADVIGDWFFVYGDSVQGTLYFLPAFIFSILGSVFATITIMQATRECREDDATEEKVALDSDDGEESMSKKEKATNTGNQDSDGSQNDSRRRSIGFLPFFSSWKVTFQLLEIVAEDVPQIVLSCLVRGSMSSWSPYVVLNLTTSIYNIVFDVLDILEETDSSQALWSSFVQCGRLEMEQVDQPRAMRRQVSPLLQHV